MQLEFLLFLASWGPFPQHLNMVDHMIIGIHTHTHNNNNIRTLLCLLFEREEKTKVEMCFECLSCKLKPMSVLLYSMHNDTLLSLEIHCQDLAPLRTPPPIMCHVCFSSILLFLFFFQK